jgi:tetratricopeptide (TPR) repeat protein
MRGDGAFHWEQALSRLDTALRLNPASPWSRFWHGVVLCGLKRVDESLAEMRRAVELDPLATLFHAYLWPASTFGPVSTIKRRTMVARLSKSTLVLPYRLPASRSCSPP